MLVNYFEFLWLKNTFSFLRHYIPSFRVIWFCVHLQRWYSELWGERTTMCIGNIINLFFFYSNIIIVQMCVVRAGRAAPQFICMDACGDKAGTRLRATARFYFIRYFSGNKNCFTSFIVAFMIILIYSRFCWSPTHSGDKFTACRRLIIISMLPVFLPVSVKLSRTTFIRPCRFVWNHVTLPKTPTNMKAASLTDLLTMFIIYHSIILSN